MKPLRIESVWVFVAVDDDGNEGVIAHYQSSTNTWLPLVAADPERVGAIRVLAELTCRASGKTARLVRFTHRTDLETIEP